MIFNGIDIESLIGVPYKDQGTNPQEGFDCATLVRYVTGIEANVIPSLNPKDRLSVMRAIKKNKRHFRVIENEEDYQDGDIVAMKILRNPHHLGIYIQGNVLHADDGGVMYSSFQNLRQNGYTCEVGRFIDG